MIKFRNVSSIFQIRSDEILNLVDFVTRQRLKHSFFNVFCVRGSWCWACSFYCEYLLGVLGFYYNFTKFPFPQAFSWVKLT